MKTMSLSIHPENRGYRKRTVVWNGLSNLCTKQKVIESKVVISKPTM